MPDRPRLPAITLRLCVGLILLVPSALRSQEDPPPTPADPALAAAWSKVEAARARFTAADRKYQDAQNAARSAPSSAAKAAAKAAKKERDRAQRDVKSAESSWRKQVAAYQKRRPSAGMPVEPPTEVVPVDPRAPSGDKVKGATPTPTAIPLGSDVLLPTPVREVPATPTVTVVEQGPPAAPAASPFQGSYTGEWVNNTFGSRGPASAVITIDTAARTFQVVLTLGGQVFGVGAPPPQTFTGSYDASGRSIQTRSDLLGNLSISISSSGAISGTATGLPNPSIAQVDFTGTATPQSIRVNYTVSFSSGGQSAQGVMTLNR